MRHAWANKVGMLSLVGVMVLAGDSYAVVSTFIRWGLGFWMPPTNL